MKIALNDATTLENATLEQELDLCEKNGYDFIEIRTMDKLPEYLQNHSLQDLNQYFEHHHLKPLALNALVYFNNRSETDRAGIIKEFRHMMDISDAIHCPYVVAVPLVTQEKFFTKDIKASCVSVLRELSDIAAPHHVKIPVEFLGHPQATVNRFEQAYEIVQTVNRDNVGLTLDSFHFHGMGSSLSALEKADGDKIFLYHINDTDDIPIGFLRDEDRLWPGDGCIDLRGILKALKKIGYTGAATLELFRPEYYKLPAEEVVKKGKEKTLKVVNQYFN
jgi:2-keto-myo-inositol isomerase